MDGEHDMTGRDGVTTLLLVRHGQSTWNAEGRWQGQADPPLSATGRLQAQRATERVGAVDAIVSSTQQRAAETADIIAEAIGIGPVSRFDGLRERFVGPWSGLTRAEIDEAFPGYLENGQRPAEYEDNDALLTRTLAALHEVIATHHLATVLVATHGGVIHNLEGHLGLDLGRVPNLTGRVVHHHQDQLVAGAQLTLVDDVHSTGGDPNRV